KAGPSPGGCADGTCVTSTGSVTARGNRRPLTVRHPGRATPVDTAQVNTTKTSEGALLRAGGVLFPSVIHPDQHERRPVERALRLGPAPQPLPRLLQRLRVR